MAIAEPRTVKDMYVNWTVARLRGEERDGDRWGDVTREPGAVDYLETEVRGLRAMWAIPKSAAEDRVLLCMHGGGYVSGSIYTHRKLYAHIAKAAGVRALLFDYRLAPGAIHPAQVDDATAVYRWLLDEGFDPGRIAFAGDSSGGGLALTTQLRAREHGLPLPAAAVLLSPWVDMEVNGVSYESNRSTEIFFSKEFVAELVPLFLGPDGSPRDPLANPLYADLAGVAPAYVQVGGDETLLDDGRRLAVHARGAGVDVRLDVFAGQQHTFQMAAGRAPEADEAIASLAAWLRPRLGLPVAPAPATAS